MARTNRVLFLGLVLALVGAACGSSDDAKTTTAPDVAALAPADNVVPGWVGDTTNATTGGVTKIARNYTDAVNLIDGSADPFWKQSTGITAKGLAMNNYVNTANATITIEHKAWQLASAADCLTVYADLLTYATYSAQPWQDIALGDKARVASAVAVRINVCKGAYLLETSLFGDASSAGKDRLVEFLTPILAKIP
jgi:hypothetical protein